MLTILLHSSKTMRTRVERPKSQFQPPALLSLARQLGSYVQTLSEGQLMQSMRISLPMAEKTRKLMTTWRATPEDGFLPAIDAFLGDIYSGLQVLSFDELDREYANQHLLILSGLYGGLRALDSILPYRLEMGYQLPDEPYRNLYSYWGDEIAKCVPRNTTALINLSAVEYTKALLPHLDESVSVISPKFLTCSSKTGQPRFVAVHAKIARGAFAHWMIRGRVDDIGTLAQFNALGYVFSEQMSTPETPVFVCQEFKGLVLSVRRSQGEAV